MCDIDQAKPANTAAANPNLSNVSQPGVRCASSRPAATAEPSSKYRDDPSKGPGYDLQFAFIGQTGTLRTGTIRSLRGKFHCDKTSQRRVRDWTALREWRSEQRQRRAQDKYGQTEQQARHGNWVTAVDKCVGRKPNIFDLQPK
jgi:hypothetical protein